MTPSAVETRFALLFLKIEIPMASCPLMRAKRCTFASCRKISATEEIGISPPLFVVRWIFRISSTFSYCAFKRICVCRVSVYDEPAGAS